MHNNEFSRITLISRESGKFQFPLPIVTNTPCHRSNGSSGRTQSIAEAIHYITVQVSLPYKE